MGWPPAKDPSADGADALQPADTPAERLAANRKSRAAHAGARAGIDLHQLPFLDEERRRCIGNGAYPADAAVSFDGMSAGWRASAPSALAEADSGILPDPSAGILPGICLNPTVTVIDGEGVRCAQTAASKFG